MSSGEEHHRAEDFINAFNSIEREIKLQTHTDEGDSFKSALEKYRQHRGWYRTHRDFKALEDFAKIRNILVHKRFGRYEYRWIPSAKVLAEIKAIERRLTQPLTAYSEFERKVTTVERETPLKEVLELIRTTDFTQFPVYHQGKFDNLVTSNGITRWLAEQYEQLSIIDIDAHTVSDLLEREEKRPDYTFVARNDHVDDVAYAFQENPRLEAALVTENGRQSETLLGIATQADIASLVRD